MIDLSDNDIKKLDNLGPLTRLSVLLLNNNSITKIGSIHLSVPNLQGLILTNNKITMLSEINKLSSCPKLEVLSLLENPISYKQHYRSYIIYTISTLKSLDFHKISSKEREEARKLFSSVAGKAFLMAIQAEYLAGLPPKMVIAALTDGQKAQIKRAIEAADTKEEIDLIELQLKVRVMMWEMV